MPESVESDMPTPVTPVLARLPRLLPSSVDPSTCQQYRFDFPNRSLADLPPKTDPQIPPDANDRPDTPACRENPPLCSITTLTDPGTADEATEAGSNATEFEVGLCPTPKFSATNQPDTPIATAVEQSHVNRSPLAHLVLVATLLVAAALGYLLLENHGDSDLKSPHIPQPTFAGEPKLTTVPPADPTTLAKTQIPAHTRVQVEPATPSKAEPAIPGKTEVATKTNAVAKNETTGGEQNITAQGPGGSYQPTSNSRSMTTPLIDSSQQLTTTADRYDSVHNKLPVRRDRLPFVDLQEKHDLTKQAEPLRQPRYPSTGQPATTIFPNGDANYRVEPPAAVAELTGFIEPTTTKR